MQPQLCFVSTKLQAPTFKIIEGTNSSNTTGFRTPKWTEKGGQSKCWYEDNMQDGKKLTHRLPPCRPDSRYRWLLRPTGPIYLHSPSAFLSPVHTPIYPFHTMKHYSYNQACNAQCLAKQGAAASVVNQDVCMVQILPSCFSVNVWTCHLYLNTSFHNNLLHPKSFTPLPLKIRSQLAPKVLVHFFFPFWSEGGGVEERD